MIAARELFTRTPFLEITKAPFWRRESGPFPDATARLPRLSHGVSDFCSLLFKNRRFSNVKIPLDSYRLSFDKSRHEFPAVNLNRRSGDRVNKRQSSANRDKSPKGGRAALPRQASPRPERPARPLAPRRRVTSMFPEEEEMPPPLRGPEAVFLELTPCRAGKA